MIDYLFVYKSEYIYKYIYSTFVIHKNISHCNYLKSRIISNLSHFTHLYTRRKKGHWSTPTAFMQIEKPYIARVFL